MTLPIHRVRPLAVPLFRFRPSRFADSMPLRAKITNLEMNSGRSISTDIKPRTDDPIDDVVFNSLYGLRTIELNRPKKLNSLDGSMCRKIVPTLLSWERSDMINAVVMKGAGDRALCAGGDVATLAKWNKEGKPQDSADYFALEYKLDHLIATYPKPYIAFMDGATMGGGVGLSVHAPFRIATERTVLAMPETRIGFFPEVGASFFLSRLDGGLGKYLALTSENLRGVQALYHGLATHYLHSSSLPDLESRLAELRIPDYTSPRDRLLLINSTIAEFTTGLPHDQPIQLRGELRQTLDWCFASSDIRSILWRLNKVATTAATPEPIQQWAKKTIDTIQERSPTSVKVTLRQLTLGKTWTIAEAFRREHLIASHFMKHPDFTTGVYARLIDKTKGRPAWQPASLDEVTDSAVDAFFKPTEGMPGLQLLRSGKEAEYMSYPHAWTVLPSDAAVQAVVEQGGKSRQAILAHFLQLSDGKLGMREKVEETLDRMTDFNNEGDLIWRPKMIAAAAEAQNNPDRSSPDPDPRA